MSEPPGQRAVPPWPAVCVAPLPVAKAVSSACRPDAVDGRGAIQAHEPTRRSRFLRGVPASCLPRSFLAACLTPRVADHHLMIKEVHPGLIEHLTKTQAVGGRERGQNLRPEG